MTKPLQNPWPCHVETSSVANALDQATTKRQALAEGTAETSNVELGACAVLKPLSRVLPPTPRRHPPEDTAARYERLVWRTVIYNGMAEASAKSLALPCRGFLRSRCTRQSHPRKTSLCRMYSLAIQGRTWGVRCDKAPNRDSLTSRRHPSRGIYGTRRKARMGDWQIQWEGSSLGQIPGAAMC